jgi:hypothetical protein
MEAHQERDTGKQGEKQDSAEPHNCAVELKSKVKK